MDVCLLSRIQFAVTIGFHFLFPPITIGLAWVLVAVEYLAWRRGDAVCDQVGRLFGKLLGLTFAVGVATGIVMEFQFGANWARYSKFVGDIFGAPLAAEGVLAFFLESTFLGVYLFARDRLSRRGHWFSILMVAVGATLSAFWIIVANSWMQTPAGYTVNAAAGRAELTDFWAAVFNPSTLLRYAHTMAASLVCGAFFVAGAAAYMLLRARPGAGGAAAGGAAAATGPAAMARRALAIALVVGLAASVLVAVPTGDSHARQVAEMQPEKFAAIEGLYRSRDGAPLVIFGLPRDNPPRVESYVEIPGLLSLLAFGDTGVRVRGLEEFPADEIPPVWLTFISFRTMVALGMFFIVLGAYGVWRLWRGNLLESRRLLWLLVVSAPLPLAACQLGWIVAEVGRQPWIVYKLMRTADAFSTNLTAGEVLASLVLFSLIYLALLALYLWLLARILRRAAAEAPAA
jgi:cytochrome d ubiquinol oxidase subunit I